MSLDDSTAMRSLKPITEPLDDLEVGEEDDDVDESTVTEDDNVDESLEEALEATAIAERESMEVAGMAEKHRWTIENYLLTRSRQSHGVVVVSHQSTKCSLRQSS